MVFKMPLTLRFIVLLHYLGLFTKISVSSIIKTKFSFFFSKLQNFLSCVESRVLLNKLQIVDTTIAPSILYLKLGDKV